MAALHCSCPQKHEIWGELWWAGGKHEWVFYDNLKTSETYGKGIVRCPACSHWLERKNLKAV
jgi:hypothetical protein